MGYGYRNMSADELKGFTMEITFDSVGCNLTLFAGDAWHCTKSASSSRTPNVPTACLTADRASG